MQDFLLGMISMAAAVAALLFFRFWRSSGDRFFLFFAAAFVVEATGRASFAAFSAASEFELLYYLGRLVTFALILLAIADKNLRHKPTRSAANSRDIPTKEDPANVQP